MWFAQKIICYLLKTKFVPYTDYEKLCPLITTYDANGGYIIDQSTPTPNKKCDAISNWDRKQWAIIESSESIILFFFVRWMPVIFKLTKPIEIAFNV